MCKCALLSSCVHVHNGFTFMVVCVTGAIHRQSLRVRDLAPLVKVWRLSLMDDLCHVEDEPAGAKSGQLCRPAPAPVFYGKTRPLCDKGWRSTPTVAHASPQPLLTEPWHSGQELWWVNSDIFNGGKKGIIQAGAADKKSDSVIPEHLCRHLYSTLSISFFPA